VDIMCARVRALALLCLPAPLPNIAQPHQGQPAFSYVSSGHGGSHKSEQSLLEQRAAVWSLAHIASSAYGVALVPFEIFSLVTDMALNASILSIRRLSARYSWLIFILHVEEAVFVCCVWLLSTFFSCIRQYSLFVSVSVSVSAYS
jgi:hypothetical protein